MSLEPRPPRRALRGPGLAVMLSLAAAAAWAQDHTGMISGTVVDEQGQIVPGVPVTLVSETTGFARPALTDHRGDFRFLGVQPGTYTVRVELSGFSPLELRGKVLPTSSSLDLGKLRLRLGGRQDTVTVVAEGTAIETQNSSPSSLLTATQIEQISTIGRDVTSLLRLLPGVAYQDDADSLGGEGFASGLPNIGGARKHFNHITVDGVFGNEIGGANNFSMLVNLDAIAEVKVLGSTYQAEYGRGTSQIQISGKQGGSEYHGSLAYYKRHEAFNASDFFRNAKGLPKAKYRFNTYDASLGGPVALPGLFTPKDKKLFFHYAVERALTTNPRAVREFRIPTLKERSGDFSETRRAPSRTADGQCVPGSLIVVTDPLTRHPFPGNIIPPGRINPSGRALLGMFPEPNLADPCLPENYRMTPSTDIPKWNHSLRFDYKASPGDVFYLIFRNNISEQIGFQTSAGPGARGRWGLYESHYRGDSNSATLGHSHSFGRGLLNEALVSYRRDTERTFTPDDNLFRMQRAGSGYSLSQLHPDINPLDLVPNAQFRSSNIPVRETDNTAEVEINNRFPLDGKNFAVNFRDSLTWSKGRHIFKGGVYFEYLDDNEGVGANQGTFNFQNDSANNPYVTGFGYANALIGAYHSYSEASVRRTNDGHGAVAEWYVQDRWRASRKLTLDLGVRFQWVAQPWRKGNDQFSVFVPDRWDPARAPVLYVPFRSGNATLAMDPRTGQTFAGRLVGTYIPGTGDPNNGMVLAGDPPYPSGFRRREPPLPEPRLGFAYDPAGGGKTVFRGGFGLTHQPQLGVGIVTDLGGNPPFGRTETTDFGTFDTLVGTTRFLAPVDVRGFDPGMKTPSMYNFSVGVEQAIGFGTVVGASYVGALGRHLNQQTNLNLIPPGTRFLPQYRDNGGNAYPDNLLRPFRGYGAVNWRSNFGTSNYHALQVSVVRRHIRGLQYSLAYTWSRALGISDEDGENIILYRPLRAWHYGPHQRSQTHNLEVSYTWDVPKASRLSNTRLVRFLFDGWQVSGENVIVSGSWKDVVLDRNNVDFTGGTLDTSTTGTIGNLRPIMIGNPNARHGDGIHTPWFDTSVFKRPEVPAPGAPITSANYGTTPRRVVRLPGVSNWNLSFFKNFSLAGKRTLQFRWEMYNVLNKTQLSDINTTARFDADGNQINPDFGFATAARDPRRMQGSLRFSF